MTALTLKTQAPPTPRKLRSSSRGRKTLKGAAGFVLILVLGQMLPATVFAGQSFPTTAEIAVAMGQILTTSATWLATGQTMLGWLVGFVVAAMIAILGGLAIGSFPTVRLAFNFPVEFLRVIPPIILIPVVVLLQGPTLNMKVSLTILGAIWPILYQTVYGLRSIDRTVKDTARIYRFSLRKNVLGVILPAALPFIVTGLRIGATIGIMVAIVAEMVGGAPGIGREIYLAQSNGQYASMMAFLVLSGILGMAVNSSLRLVEKSGLRWHPSQRSN
ncbi:ABC transporter permease [Pseudarthrobacter sp. H2]|uniref:ABC transporter permease n=1 Tax=Pseudarthrobacter sp. H2 TaxID=3418415 RepID=UPI003CE938E0